MQRDVIVLLLASLLVVIIYRSTLWSLSQIHSNVQLGVLPPSVPLGLVFLLLFVMLTITNLVASLSSLYLSDDLDLVLASPIPFHRFFTGKFVAVAFSSAWMPFVFLIPFLLGFGNFYKAGYAFYLFCPFIIIPFFLIPPSLSILLGTLLSWLLPTTRTKALRAALVMIFLLTIGSLLALIRESLHSPDTSAEVVRVLVMFGTPSTIWLPSYWAASFLQELLRPTQYSALPELVLLFSVASGGMALSYLVLDVFHHRAYSNAKNNRSLHRPTSKVFALFKLFTTWITSRREAALIGKEFRMLFREITALLELSMLIGLCVVYLYNLRSFAVLSNIPDEARSWWRGMLFCLNVLMNSFITVAISTRFVFPSVSREGRAWWILETSPLAIGQVLETKFQSWIVPVAFVSISFFLCGCWALDVSTLTLVLMSFLSAIISYGIVRSAIGFGAMFAVFDWEHPSQLAAGFGSFVYMLYSVSLIFVSMIPAALILFTPQKIAQLHGESPLLLFAYYCTLLGAIVTLHLLSCRWAFHKGHYSLVEQSEG